MSDSKKRRKKGASHASVVVGVAWYRREEWERLLAVASDREKLQDTYDQWLESAKETLLELARRGLQAEKVDVGVDELVEWCRKRGVPVNGEARSEYASFKLFQLHNA